jgi:hypothetical protein
MQRGFHEAAIYFEKVTCASREGMMWINRVGNRRS